MPGAYGESGSSIQFKGGASAAERRRLLMGLMGLDGGGAVQPTGPFGPPGGIDNLTPTGPVAPPSFDPTANGPIPNMPIYTPGVGFNPNDPSFKPPVASGNTPTGPTFGVADPNSGPGGMANDFGSWWSGLDDSQRAQALQASGGPMGLQKLWMDTVVNPTYFSATNTSASGIVPPTQPFAAIRGTMTAPGVGGPIVRNTAPMPGQSGAGYGGVNPFLRYQTGNFGSPTNIVGPAASPTPTTPKPSGSAVNIGTPPYKFPTYKDLGMAQPPAVKMPGYNAPNSAVPPGGIDYGDYSTASGANNIPNLSSGMPKFGVSTIANNRPKLKKKSNNIANLTRFILGY